MTTETKLPVMFRGSERVYRVIGVQGDTVYGLNLGLSYHTGKQMNLDLVFACLGMPAEGSPFKVRSRTEFPVAFEEEPKGKVKFGKGCRLQKVSVALGSHLSTFDGIDYIRKHLPDMQAWLEQTLENAGVAPTFNKVEDVFGYFFKGADITPANFLPFELKPFGTYESKEEFKVDFSKFGKQPPHGTPNPETGEIDAPAQIPDEAKAFLKQYGVEAWENLPEFVKDDYKKKFGIDGKYIEGLNNGEQEDPDNEDDDDL